MSSSSDRSPTPDRTHKTVAYGEYIDRQIDKTGRQVKLTEIFGGVFLLVAGLLVFFLSAAVIDHWIVPLRTLGRWSLLLLLVAGVMTFVVFRLVPLFFRRVNRVYSAHTIERQAPAMKNSLVNHLMLKQEGRGVSKGVLRAVEQQAAQRLSQTAPESAVDRSRLIRLGYLLVGLMAVAALYKFISPKDPLATFGRIAAPWSDVAAPTRVVIEQVRHSANPGGQDAAGLHVAWVYAEQQPVQVDAAVRGLKRDEPVTLYWSTEDGRVERQPIVMRPQGDGRMYRCLLPDDTVGLRQNVRFFVAAGDARSIDFRIEVRTPPVIAVKRVEYSYPAYTHKRPETRTGGGDIIAMAGTTVTLHAEANQPIKSADVDLGGDGARDYGMQIAGQQATATFPLVLDVRGNAPTSYLIRMTNADGHENPQPIRYNLQIIPDRPPTVRIVKPAVTADMRELQLPLNAAMPIVVEASDPDFALSKVEISAATADSPNNLLMADTILEDEVKDFTNADAPYTFRPDSKQLSRTLKVGDTVHLWAIARDNKRDLENNLVPNVAKSEELVIRIIAPSNDPQAKMQPKNDPTKKQDEKPKPSDDKTPGGNDAKQPPDKKEPEQKQDGNQKSKEKDNGAKKEGDQKQPGNDGQGKEKEKGKEGSKSEGGQKGSEKGMDQIFNDLHREAEKEQAKKEKQSLSGNSPEKQKGAGGGASQPPPDGGPKTPPDQAPQAGSGGNKKEASKTSPGGMGDTPSEHMTDPTTDGQNTPPNGSASDHTGRNKTAGEKLPGGAKSTGGNSTPDTTTPPSTPSGEKRPDAKEGSKGKAADGTSTQPTANPKSNPDAKGNAGKAPNTSIGDEKSPPKPKDPGSKDAPPSVPQQKSGTGRDADPSEIKNGTPMGLSDTKTKINNKQAADDHRPGEKQTGDHPTSPSTNDKETNNTNKSGTKDGEQSGGSAPGGGQRGKQKGTGSAGSGEEANDGMGAGKSEGMGETGTGPGKKVKSNTPTGQSGNETGNGSSTVEGGSNPGAAKARPDKQPGGADSQSGSAGGAGKQDSRGQHGTPQTGARGDGQRQFEATAPADPNLEAARKAADLVLKHIDGHPDEEAFKTPQVVELRNRLWAMLNGADKQGPQGDIARQQLLNLGRGFSTRGMKRDDQGGIGELRGDRRGIPGYADEYLERTGTRPPRR